MIAEAWLFTPALAGSAVVVAWGWNRGARRASGWVVAGLLGQAAALGLWRAGPLVGYQHLLSPAEAAGHRSLSLLVATAVIIATAVAVARRWLAVRTWISGHQVRGAIVTALGVGVLLAVAPSAQSSRWARELAFGAVLQVAALACVALAVSALPDELASNLTARIERWFGGSDLPGARVALAAAAFVTIVSAVLALASYQRHPHVPDEVAFLVQAKYFARAMLWMDAPAVPSAFETFCLTVAGDRWYSVLQPGWPLILAIGVLARVEWLVNPVLGGVAVYLAFQLVRELGTERTARLAVILLAVSPWHLTLSMSFMSHVLSLVLALTTALGAVRAWRRRTLVPALAGGLALGVLGMSRPLEGVAVGLLIGVPLLVQAWREHTWRGVTGLTMGTAVTGALGLAYNRLLTGSPLVFPAESYFDAVYGPGRYSIGFGAEKGLGWTGLDPFAGHGLIDVVVNAVLNGFMVNIDLFGWWTGSVAIVGLGFAAAWRRGAAGLDRAMAVAILVIVGAHSFFWFSGGPDFGARYWYLIIVPCVVLAVRGIDALDQRRRDAVVGPSQPRRALIGAALLVSGALLLFVPWRARDKYFQYRRMLPDVRAFADDDRYAGSLVLIQGRANPDWSSAIVYNSVDRDSSAPLFAWDRDLATRAALFAAYPDRPVFLVMGPSMTGSGYVTERGPISAAERGKLPPPPPWGEPDR